jgi:hypothetical protein
MTDLLPHGVPHVDATDTKVVDLYGVRMMIINPLSPVYGKLTVQRTETLGEAYAWRDDIAFSEYGKKMFDNVEIVSARVSVGPWQLMSVAKTE